jgi:peptide chain release factor 1
MEDKLKAILDKYNNLTKELQDPNIINDVGRFKRVSQEQKHIEPVASAAEKYLKIVADLASNKELVHTSGVDSDLREFAYAESEELEQERQKLEEELRFLLIPTDPNDMKSCIMEIRAGTGGDEAGIFAGDLYRMYQKYAEKIGFTLEVIEFNESERGGFKEITLSVVGDGAFGELKFESGVHRVQRVPETEASGRLHTSAATVAILPEAEDVDVEIREEDLRIDIFRSGGKGGQNVNKVETAVRIVHNPTGIVVKCQEERSQLKNREKAMKVLRSRLYEIELERQQSEISSSRKSMVKSGDRSEKIRTYNYPQNRVTDHRLEGDAKNYTLREVVEGDLQPIIENLKLAERAEIMKAEVV